VHEIRLIDGGKRKRGVAKKGYLNCIISVICKPYKYYRKIFARVL